MKKSKHRPRSLFKSLLIRLTLWTLSLTAVAAVAGFLWIDHQIQERFSGQLWDIPIHIYSRSFEIYPGLAITGDQLETRLDGLGYRQVAKPTNQGEYARVGDIIELVSREFDFWDGPQQSMAIRLQMGKTGIGRITERETAQSLSLLRLSPVLIGSLSQLQHEDRKLLRLDEMPKLLLTTLVAIEDRNFTRHHGIDLRAIARAAWTNLVAGRIRQGGSTLTQQLIKNVFGRDELTYQRKLLEMAMAVVIEVRLEKHEILEAYCNEVFLGQDGKRAIHGFGLGSQYLFGRPLSELNAAEIAQLVGMIKAPTSYNPMRNPERARERRGVVLKVMLDDGLISEEVYRQSVDAPLNLASSRTRTRNEFAWFTDMVLRQLSDRVNARALTEAGLSVFTTMDVEVQRAAQSALTSELDAIERRRGIPAGTLEGAIVVLRPDDGEVLAVAGGRNAHVGTFNRALDAFRPVGSLIKPVVYLTAFIEDKKWTLARLVADKPFSYKLEDGRIWSPENYDEEYEGDVSVLEALAASRNVPAARVGTEVGVRSVADNLRRLGVDIQGPVYPSLLLGAVELSPTQVAVMYQALANFGYRVRPRTISTITSGTGEASPPLALRAESVVPSDPAFLVLFAMQEAVANGTGRGLQRTFPAGLKLAGKTGTTDDYRDSWFVGVSGNMLAAVWVGRDDNQPTGLTGAGGALRVWEAMMRQLNLQPLELGAGNAIEFVDIDLDSGLRSQGNCTEPRRIPFLKGTAPRRFVDCGSQR